MPRYFAAIFVPENVQGHLTGRRRSAPPISDLRWVPERSLHVTLNFLGEIDDGRRPAAERALSATARGRGPLRLSCAGAGVFPSPGKASSFWVGLAGDTAALSAMAGDLSEALAAEGFHQQARDFKPHLTVARRDGRARGPMGGRPRAAEEFQALFRDYQSPAFEVRELHLVLSRPNPSGPDYASVFRAPLAAPSGLL